MASKRWSFPKIRRVEPYPHKIAFAYVAQMWQRWWAERQAAVAEANIRARQDLRVRRDGSPSARPPVPSLPLDFWAVVEDPPDGGDYYLSHKLARYQGFLKKWKDHGLYDGPTELTYESHEKGPPDAGA